METIFLSFLQAQLQPKTSSPFSSSPPPLLMPAPLFSVCLHSGPPTPVAEAMDGAGGWSLDVMASLCPSFLLTPFLLTAPLLIQSLPMTGARQECPCSGRGHSWPQSPQRHPCSVTEHSFPRVKLQLCPQQVSPSAPLLLCLLRCVPM